MYVVWLSSSINEETDIPASVMCTSRNYISWMENERSSIKIEILYKIVTLGIGQELNIFIGGEPKISGGRNQAYAKYL
ncbi:MAG: hypothetical protein ABI378_05760 [Chitinophagaceae bacterium]